MDNTEAREYLANELSIGQTAYTVTKHTSQSGMQRSISTYIVRNGDIVDITWAVADLLDYPIDNKHGGMKVRDAGMDMGYHVVYSIAAELFQDEGERTGYTLHHMWL